MAFNQQKLTKHYVLSNYFCTPKLCKVSRFSHCMCQCILYVCIVVACPSSETQNEKNKYQWTFAPRLQNPCYIFTPHAQAHWYLFGSVHFQNINTSHVKLPSTPVSSHGFPQCPHPKKSGKKTNQTTEMTATKTLKNHLCAFFCQIPMLFCI